MENIVLDYYSSLRKIFGVCDCCGEIFRISDCNLYQKKKEHTTDWKEKIDSELSRLDNLESKLEEKIELAREAAREAGRKDADNLIKKIDPIFSPLKLNPNDAKVVFHPVDFIVFNGMNNNKDEKEVKSLVLLDKNNKEGEYKNIQDSIDNAISKSNYEWLTLRVQDDGTISEE